MKNEKVLKKQEMLFSVIVTLFWFGQYVYIPYQIIYLSEKSINEYAIGIIVGVYGLSQLLCRFPIGIVANTISKHKNFIILGCFLSALASIFRITLESKVGFFIGNIFSGLASTTWISFMIFYLNKYDEERQQSATSKIVMLNNIGMLLGFIVSTVLYYEIGMRNICILSILSGIIACLFSFYLFEDENIKVEISFKKIIIVCGNRRLWILAIFALVQQGIQMTTTMSFTNKILQQLSASSFVIGISSIIYMGASVLFSKLGSTSLIRKKSPKFWISFIFLILAIYTILVSNVNKVSYILILQLLPGMGTGILFAFLTSEALKEIEKTQKTVGMGLYQAIYALGMTMFPIIFGNIIENYGIRIGYNILGIISFIMSILGLVCYTFIFDIKKRKNNIENC